MGGDEPPLFTCHFLGWEAKGPGFVDPYTARMNANREAQGLAPEPQAARMKRSTSAITAADTVMFGATGTFALSVLQVSIPEGVDPKNKEKYLSDEEFQSTFGMDKA